MNTNKNIAITLLTMLSLGMLLSIVMLHKPVQAQSPQSNFKVIYRGVDHRNRQLKGLRCQTPIRCSVHLIDDFRSVIKVKNTATSGGDCLIRKRFRGITRHGGSWDNEWRQGDSPAQGHFYTAPFPVRDKDKKKCVPYGKKRIFRGNWIEEQHSNSGNFDVFFERQVIKPYHQAFELVSTTGSKFFDIPSGWENYTGVCIYTFPTRDDPMTDLPTRSCF